MNHREIEDQVYELYVLDVLETAESEEIDAHLRNGCEYCQAKLLQARRVGAALSGMANQVEPPAALRRRVLASVAPRAHSRYWWYSIAGLAAACIALLALSIWSVQQNKTVTTQLAHMRAQRDQLRSALELMSRSETRAVQFGNLENAPQGRVFVSRNGGIVFVGTKLPSLPTNKTFELWVVPATGAPLPAGTFRPDANNASVNITPPNINASGAAAVAVSIEPAGGSNAPTTKPFLIVPLA